MSDVFFNCFVGLVGGLVLGTVLFGGLKLTVSRMVHARYPLRLLFLSMGLRFGLVLTGFGALSALHWQAAVAGLVGFLIVRLILLSHVSAREVR